MQLIDKFAIAELAGTTNKQYAHHRTLCDAAFPKPVVVGRGRQRSLWDEDEIKRYVSGEIAPQYRQGPAPKRDTRSELSVAFLAGKFAIGEERKRHTFSKMTARLRKPKTKVIKLKAEW